MSLLRISRDRNGMLEVTGRSWQADGMLSARYWSEAAREKKDPPGVFYYWKGERPRHPNAPAVGRDGGDQTRIRGSRRRLLDHLHCPNVSAGHRGFTCAPVSRT